MILSFTIIVLWLHLHQRIQLQTFGYGNFFIKRQLIYIMNLIAFSLDVTFGQVIKVRDAKTPTIPIFVSIILVKFRSKNLL